MKKTKFTDSPYLKNEIFKTRFLADDLIAAATVICVALPLSLALALASGMDPMSGVITSVIGGIICGLLGGSKLSISGPANAMPILTATVIHQYGVGGLAVLILVCGALQITSGSFGFGRFIRFTPLPVIYGFTAGIGSLLFVNQLPRALGLPPPDQSYTINILMHVFGSIRTIQTQSLLIAILTILVFFLFPKLSKKVPSPLLAVLIPSFLVTILHIKTPIIGHLPSTLPLWNWPHLPTNNLGDFVSLIFVAFSLMSIETLLSSVGVEKVTHERSNPDKELIAQGIANLGSGLFGGLPITSVLARSVLNVEAGAKTRRSSVFHSLFLVFSILFLSPWMSQIPVAVLAGLILSVALRMLHPKEFIKLWKVSRSESFVGMLTFIAITFIGLISGIQAGLAAALVITAFRLGNTSAKIDIFGFSGLSHLSINGSLTFMSAATIEGIRRKLESESIQKGLIVDMSRVKEMDSSGAIQFLEVLDPNIQKRKVAFVGLSSKNKSIFLKLNYKVNLAGLIASNDNEVFKILDHSPEEKNLNRLRYGVERFKHIIGSEYGTLFIQLAQTQYPHTLFITCCDSRIDPNLITSTDPGELFVLRNIGNLIPQANGDCTPAEGAAIEFAIAVLGVKEVVICGHSECGAIKGFLSGEPMMPSEMEKVPHIVTWLKQLEELRPKLSSGCSVREAVEVNVIQQIENLKSYPIVREKLLQGHLRIHAWYYDIGETEVEEWNESERSFSPISPTPALG